MSAVLPGHPHPPVAFADRGPRWHLEPDADGDGFGAMDGLVLHCPAAGYTLDASDCDDSDFTINPGAEDVCGDEIDNDCDLNADEDCGPACPCAVNPDWTEALESGVPDLFCVDNAEFAGSYYTTDGVTYGYVVGVSVVGEHGVCYGSGTGSFFDEYFMVITVEEGLACMNDISAWLDANGATCSE